MRSRHSQYSKLGVFQNLYVLLWRGIYYAKKIPNRELQNENLSIFCYTVSTKIPIRNSENMDSGTRGGGWGGKGRGSGRGTRKDFRRANGVRSTDKS